MNEWLLQGHPADDEGKKSAQKVKHETGLYSLGFVPSPALQKTKIPWLWGQNGI